MAGEKTLAFSIAINGISNENVELQKLNLQFQNLNKEYKDLQKTIKEQGGLASNDQLQQLAAYSKEINNHKDSIKELNRVMDSAPDSLNRMRAELIRAKDAAAGCSTEIRERMSPYINKMSDDVKKAEAAMGVHSRGVGNYKESIKSAALQLLSFGAVVGLATAAVRKLYDAFLETEAGAKFQGQIKQISRTFLQDLIPAIKEYWGAFLSGDVQKAGDAQKNFLKSLADSSRGAAELDKLRIKGRSDLKEIAQIELDIKELKIKAAGQTGAAQLATYLEADKKENEVIKKKKDSLIEYIDALKVLAQARKNDTTLLDEINDKEIELIQVKGEKSLKIATKIATDKAKILKDEETAQQKSLEEKELMERYTQEFFDKEEKRQQKSLEEKELMERYTQEYFDKEEKRNQESLTDKELMERWTQEYFDKDKKRDQAKKDRVKELRNVQLQMAAEAANGIFDINTAKFNNELTNLNKEKATILSNKNLTESQKAAIDAEYEKKANIIRTKQARADKEQALFNIALNTAMGVINATSKVITIPLIPWIIAMGVLQAGLVAAKPIPQFARGGKINRGVSINTGTTDDTLIAVNKTETVLTQRHVAALGGSGAMHRIGVPGYASGGYVGQQATAIPPSEIDYDKLAEANRRYLNVVLDINKLNQAQNELSIITTTNRI